MSRFEHVFSLKHRCAVGIVRGGGREGGVAWYRVYVRLVAAFQAFSRQGTGTTNQPHLWPGKQQQVVALLAIPMPARSCCPFVFGGTPGDE